MQEREYMELALSLAKAGKGQTSPNPAVGAVVVKNGEIVGMGAHLKAGEPHAEVHAIRQAGAKAVGADIYVTLEPCAHTGKTPPCANLIVENKLKRVFIASVDPNPLVAGKGIEILERAGIQVRTGICEEEALDLNEHFFHFIQNQTPYVTLKSAVTLDGKTASYTGDSKWITSEESRLDVHKYRHNHDAILVGVNTVIQDNPLLTTRLPRGGKNPVRVILDTNLRIPIESKILDVQDAETIIFCGSNASFEKKKYLLEKGVTIEQLDSPSLSIDLVLKRLGELRVTSLFVEGGSAVHFSFLKEKAYQEVVIYMAPKLVGGSNAFPNFGGEGFRLISEGEELEFSSVEKIGSDLKIIAKPLRKE
ncbi:bifunctional diaminohydroxyphosphoribosylaminopyrimidine deaminase/5-amino-6-(5-phosphoribosylamino)uracil reductase RibD [Rossellomorea vietnamensis]|uniref:Riboflavin biosynthesis protein RibD n=1 Tax=Rossellomorea vietnamensis TaxID=218284 RepID=A0A5D4MIL5_9BACI|nr:MULTISPECIES: bifunctional diaminohydroxyphosphoribosylaminopyrimidine deaminase/5-amino-6-(5-phosphoribosylamino)uracil reductase RibD [Bacillaceae]TYS01583.1 bifunctional diaminohydroxyphosphoribosylaminopyrimidine deaminase/5-amino-6-(5-phosphoribosylamino)uracil reductase RibD [Rossellomorea vietnamensis]